VPEPTADGAPPLRLLTLGPLQAERDGAVLALGGRQQRAVLAVLIVHRPAVVTVARIADEIWGDSVPAGYVRTIQTYVHHLREALERTPGGPNGGGRVITTTGGGYRLTVTPESVDAVAFEDLVATAQDRQKAGNVTAARALYEQALALWRGEPLSDLADLSFASAYASRLEDVRLSAVEGVIDTRLALGDHVSVLAELGDLVRRYPMRERLHAQRMLALYRSGRQAEALEAYRAVRDLLDRELGVEPSADLRQLHQAMLVQDPALAAPQTSAVASDAAESAASPSARATAAAGEPTVDDHAPNGRRRRSLAAALVALLVVAGGAVAFGAWHQPTRSLSSLPPNSLARIAADGTLHDAIPLGMSPTAVAYGAGSLWVTGGTNGLLLRIDPHSHKVIDRIPVGHTPTAIALTAQDAWVTNSRDGTVSRINTDADSEVQTVPVGAVPTAVAADSSGVWVANSSDDSIQRIDASSGKAAAPVPVGGRPDGVVVSGRTLWVANGDDSTVWEVDSTTGAPLRGPVPVGTSPAAMVPLHGSLWVADEDSQSVDRVDVRTGSVTGHFVTGDGPSAVASSGSTIWVANAYEGTVARVDTAKESQRKKFAVGASPRAFVAVGSSVWVASGAYSTGAHVGGSLSVALPYAPGNVIGVDPASAYVQGGTFSALRLVYDGLVAYRYTGGPGGLTVVPDLATSIPTPTDGGTTYAFTIRTGVRFSDGTTLKASDVKRGIIRALVAEAAPYGGGFASSLGIIGSDDCREEPSTCDLSKGVVINDTTGSLVLHLAAADPSALFKLADVSWAVPASAHPWPATAPVPGTGPYQIAQYTADADGHTLTFALRRNRFFKQWSFAAQPAGYPDEIRWVREPDLEHSVASVAAGLSDLTSVSGQLGLALGGQLESVQVQRPGSVHVDGGFALQWLYLNTRKRPFNDVRVRQALSYALDRQKLVTMAGGSSLASPGCQTLPPDFPGFEPHCPFTLGPESGPYAGPDVDHARQLVSASHTVGVPVVLGGFDDGLRRPLLEYVARILRSLGYPTSIKLINPGDYWGDPAAEAARTQAFGYMNWGADYPAASNFYFNIYSCDTNVFNCSRAIDAQAAKARDAEGTNPAIARRMWAAVDRRLTDGVFVLPLVNVYQASVVSARVGNVESSPIYGVLLSQLWVR
jgi:YVTN family beta-propeller protein